jgi:hypothetical protein
MLFPIFLIADALCILIPLPLLFTGRVRWACRAALLPIAFGLISGAIALYAHLVNMFPGWRLAASLIFAAALTSLICLLTARLLLRLGPQPKP